MSLKRCFVTIPLYYFKNNERNIEFMKTTFKKHLSIILICAMLAVLTACGTDSAMEAIKYLIGVGDLLTGRLLTFDALKMEFHTVKLPHKKGCGCAVCGPNPTITKLIDYEQVECDGK